MELQISAGNLLVPITASLSLVLAALLSYMVLWQSARQRAGTQQALATAHATTN